VRCAPLLLGLAALGCQSRAEALSVAADELLYAQKYAAAARQLEVVLHECGESADPSVLALRRRTLIRLGEVRQHYLNEPRAAVTAYRRVLSLTPTVDESVETRIRLASVLKDRLQDPLGAAAELIALLDEHPGHPREAELRLEAAKLALVGRSYNDAIRHALLIVKSADAKHRVDASLLLASAYEVQGRLDEALEIYAAMTEMNLPAPTMVHVRFEIAHLHERRGELEIALERYRAMAEAGASPEIEVRIARVEARMADMRKAGAKAGSP